MSATHINPAASTSMKPSPVPVVRPEHGEGETARLIEQQSAKLPSHLFLFGAIAAMAVSMALELTGRTRASRFVAQWPTPLLVLGTYNKLVKTLGTR